MRQDNRAPDGRRVGGDQRRARAHRRSNRQRSVAQGPRHRDGLPELRALSTPDRSRQRRLPPQDQEAAEGGDRCPGRRGRSHSRSGAVPQPQAARPLRRPASTCGDGPRHRQAPGRLPHGRTPVEPRREAAGADARGHQEDPARPVGHDRLRHARPDRGDDDGRSRSRDAEGRAAAGGPASGAVRPPGQHVRRRLHRQPGDEHARSADRPA